MNNPYEILKRPVITERATQLNERFANKVTFEVMENSNKHQIRDAVERLYGVTVQRIQTLIVPGKLKRRGTKVGKRPNWKKAIVTLKEGETIDFFASE